MLLCQFSNKSFRTLAARKKRNRETSPAYHAHMYLLTVRKENEQITSKQKKKNVTLEKNVLWSARPITLLIPIKQVLIGHFTHECATGNKWQDRILVQILITTCIC
jgi:hypothetical protein